MGCIPLHCQRKTSPLAVIFMQQRISDSFSKVEARAINQHDSFMLDTIRFFRNANELYRRFNDWKSVDRFYFIPLKLNMTYCIGGHSISMADGPVYLGTFIRNTVENPDLFVFRCPKCGKTLYPYGFNGSPLSGRVDLQSMCDCGWDGYEMVSGWRKRSDALKTSQNKDKFRLAKFRFRVKCLMEQPSTIEELLNWLK